MTVQTLAPTPKEAYDEYCDLLAQARGTLSFYRLAQKIGYDNAEARLTGVSIQEGERIFAEFATWERDQPLDPAWLKAEAAHLASLASRPGYCGHCGAEYPDMYSLGAHERDCRFRPMEQLPGMDNLSI